MDRDRWTCLIVGGVIVIVCVIAIIVGSVSR